MSVASRVVVIDDEPLVCHSCLKVLEQEGYDVCVSTNSQDGVNRVSEEHFHAAIIDLPMSAIGGMEVLRAVKTRRPETHVIIITAYSSVSTALEAKQLGAAD